MRRAGINVVVSGLKTPIICSRGVVLVPDSIVDDKKTFDCLILPGGKQASLEFKSERVQKIIRNHVDKKIACICASPIALSSIFKNKRLTSHPSVRNELSMFDYVEENVVVDGNLITGRGPDTALEFALVLASELGGTKINF